jgi:predicted dehydrogenase
MPVSRRTFLAAASAASYRRVLGANDRVGVGFVGFGLIGAQHVHDFRAQPDAAMIALCDVYQPRMEQGVAACGGTARGYRDFRKLLDDRDLDAVVVSTPDHWHALVTMMACAAGKDVYVEKPLTLFVREGRWMTDVARRHSRIVQVGTQQRSGRHYQRARELLKSRHIGQMLTARMGESRNIMPGFGNPSDGPAPNDFDYEMWLGPAPERPYNPHRALYHFRWFWDYSGGQMTNLGAHEVDIVQWVLGAKGPLAVTSTGGRWALQDDGETPDVQDALFEYPKFSALWSHREAGKGMKLQRGLEFIGTKGTLIVNRAGFDVESDMRINPENAIPLYQGMPSGGPKKAAAAVGTPWIENPEHGKGSEAEQLTNHVRNFLDCVKSRQRPISDIEDGHRTAVACHLANISLRVGRKVRWDPDTEQVIGDPEASAMLERPYRKPWDGVLRSLLA